jgi:predicted kinase
MAYTIPSCYSFLIVPGSGKSTFAKSLAAAMPYKFVRINQDDLGNRRRCEEMAHEAFVNRKCPLIDRCNFDPEQREKFVTIAYGYGASVDCVFFDSNSTLVTVDECIKRCEKRSDHPTIKPGEARGVVIGMHKQMKPPKANRNQEGLRLVQYVTDRNAYNDVLVECMNRT